MIKIPAGHFASYLCFADCPAQPGKVRIVRPQAKLTLKISADSDAQREILNKEAAEDKREKRILTRARHQVLQHQGPPGLAKLHTKWTQPYNETVKHTLSVNDSPPVNPPLQTQTYEVYI